MHIPDGFLDARTWISLSAVSAAFVALSVARANKKLGEKHIPLMGIMAAFVFAGQMIKLPIASGTSVHFMGATVVAILLGPFAGVLVSTIVLMIQCFGFGDGGVTALGANVFNMGIVCSVIGYLIYLIFYKMIKSQVGRLIGAFIATWSGIVLAGTFCAVELAISGTSPLRVVLPAMAGSHALLGLVEGLITTAVIKFILRTRPDLLELEKI